MVYENLISCKVYKPNKDGRVRCYLKFSDKTHKFMSYAKFLMECHLKRYLDKNETVDYIDQNPLNNDISNLRVLTNSQHVYNDTKRKKKILLKCANCQKDFWGFVSNRNRPLKKCKGFYFCSKHCSGTWGQQIQVGKRKIETKEELKQEYYTKHSFNK